LRKDAKGAVKKDGEEKLRAKPKGACRVGWCEVEMGTVAKSQRI